MADPIPTRIGPYRILGQLGSGGMATVYRAIQEPLDREVALKLVSPQLAMEGSFRDRFLAEARTMAKLGTPFVVTCYDAGEADGRLYMALELATGGDLLGLLARKGGRLPEPLALGLIRDSLVGLEALESAGLIHRDLKPANIFVAEDGRAKLADLGLARSTGGDRETMAGMVMGTPAYISPEQARGESDLDIRSDLFSLGATLFHLVTGGTVWVADGPMATLVRVLHDPVPDPRTRRPDLSEGISQLILRFMEKDRNRRPPSARAARDLVEILLTARPGVTSATVLRPTPLPGTTTAAGPAPTLPEVPLAPTTPLGIPAGTLQINPAQLAALTKRIVLDRDGLRAALALAPGASFPRGLLDQLLAAAGVTYGLIEANLTASGRPADLPRRIVLAQGDPPTPDCAGRTVRGEKLPPCVDRMVVRIADDRLQAAVLFRPADPPSAAEVRAALTAVGVVYGLDPAVIDRFPQGPRSGKAVVARGRKATSTILPGFVLPSADQGPTEDGCPSLAQVTAGQVVARWQDGLPGTSGTSVDGQDIPAEAMVDRGPEELVGVGVELARNRDGDLVLRSTRAGVVQLQPDGVVRVVGVVEVPGDLGPDDPPIETGDLVIVRGSVLPGARITTTSDVVIQGDLHDAVITAGGHVDVSGTIGPGDDLRASGTVIAGAVDGRRILAGNIRVNGTLRNSQLVATGDVVAEAVVGGLVSAGGNIRVRQVGDETGVPTVLWAGHHDSLDRRSDEYREVEKSHLEAREALVKRSQGLARTAEELGIREQRLNLQQHQMRPEVAEALRRDRTALDAERAQLAADAERQRQALLKTRATRERLDEGASKAGITIERIAYDGATLRTGDRDPLVLADPRLRFNV